MARSKDIRFDETSRSDVSTLRYDEHTEADLLFTKGEASNFRSQSKANVRHGVYKRDRGGLRHDRVRNARSLDRRSRGRNRKVLRSSTDEATNATIRTSSKNARSLRYTKAAMAAGAINQASRFTTSPLRNSHNSSQSDSSEDFVNTAANAPSIINARRRKSGYDPLSKKQLRRLNKKRAKALTKAAQAKRRSAKIALEGGSSTKQVKKAVKYERRARRILDRAISSLSAPASGGIGAVAMGIVSAIIVVILVFSGVVGLTVTQQQIQQQKQRQMPLTGVEAEVALFFLDKGLEPLQVAAIMGNIYQESKFDPTLHQLGGPGRGLFQWGGDGVRLEGLIAYASSKNTTWEDTQTQLEYAWTEISGQGDALPYAGIQLNLALFNAHTDIEEATIFFGRKYERPSETYAMWDVRVEAAKRYYALLTLTASLPSNEIVQFAASKLGCPYVWGAIGPNSFDCSGLVMWSYHQAGLKGMSRTTYTQIAQCVEVGADAAMPGDLIFCRFSGSRPEHVAIYIGQGKCIHAPRTGDVVKIADITWSDAKYYRYSGN